MARHFAYLMTGCLLASAGVILADEPATKPLPTPLTRPDMKQLLEDLKMRKPRFALPPLTEEEKAKLADSKFGERGGGYEGRLRALYMPGGEGRGGIGFSREADPKMSLTYEFKTQLFWIVSRTNNCQY
jgi:hypothetical protein